ncbi:MAG: type IV toxin-antitoxin system AbiEi family antitoxin domain-containing protein [Candidatus Delongbacteria bacterium]|nr:type IV toxin-antitoxin system AbiEi family antitoxin domain-containing protein [Candidatus Delongbacteria bacterium]
MTKYDKINKLLKTNKMIRSKDVEAIGIPREYLLRMERKGLVSRVSRGLYCLPGEDFQGYDSYIEVMKTIQGGVLCLISALNFHNLTTQVSPEIWIAVKNGSWRTKSETVKIRYFTFSEKNYNFGIEVHMINDVEIKVYSIAKTVADCFKFRNKIGLDVAIESLKEAIRTKKASIGEIYEAAKICRTSKVIQPYLESIV